MARPSGQSLINHNSTPTFFLSSKLSWRTCPACCTEINRPSQRTPNSGFVPESVELVELRLLALFQQKPRRDQVGDTHLKTPLGYPSSATEVETHTYRSPAAM